MTIRVYQCIECKAELITDNEIFYKLCADCRANATDLEILLEMTNEPTLADYNDYMDEVLNNE